MGTTRPSSIICPVTPIVSSSSRVAAWKVEARQSVLTSGSASTTTTGMSRWASIAAAVIPVGPAPTTITGSSPAMPLILPRRSRRTRWYRGSGRGRPPPPPGPPGPPPAGGRTVGGQVSAGQLAEGRLAPQPPSPSRPVVEQHEGRLVSPVGTVAEHPLQAGARDQVGDPLAGRVHAAGGEALGELGAGQRAAGRQGRADDPPRLGESVLVQAQLGVAPPGP